MPSSHRRRRVRAGIVTRLITKPIFLNTYRGVTEADKIQSYLTYSVNAVAQQDTIVNTVTTLRGVIGQIKTRVDYYNILETIEEQILTILCNMGDNISPGIIKLRIECVRNSILQLPEEGPAFLSQEMNDMLFTILDMIMNGVSLTNIAENISKLQQYTMEAYAGNIILAKIQTTILDTISNISDGYHNGIIALRLDYVRELLTQLELV